MTSTMQAIVRSRSGFVLERVARPTPGRDEVLIRIRAATVTAGDVVLDTIPAFARPLMRLAGFPWKRTPGHELAGVVEAVGEGVERFAVGDRVVGTTTGLRVGANAEFVALPERWPKGVLVPLPDAVGFEEAAALPIGAMTAHDLLQRTPIVPGQRALIYGASGSVGSYALQLAQHRGAEVTAVASGRNADMLRTLGADHVLDYTAAPIADHPERYHVVFDAVGKGQGPALKPLLLDGGTFLTVRSPTKEDPDALTHLVDLVAEGHVHPFIDRTYPLTDTAEAYRYVETGRKRGNIVLIP